MECNVPVYQLRSGISRQLTTFRPDTRQKTLRVEPHQRLTLVQTEETGMVTRLWLTFPGWFWQHWNPNAEIDTTLLRCLILRIYFDGNPFPSVESPVGDFFGVGHCEYRQYLSRFLGMSSGGFYSYFPMPFEKGMRIEMENLHDSIPADIFLNVNYQALEHLDAQAGRFHCQFRCGENTGPEPMDVLQTEGRGHYVGCAVSMQGQEYNYLAYLEAPEYICIDQDDIEHPQIVGTGLEDYFNGGLVFPGRRILRPIPRRPAEGHAALDDLHVPLPRPGRHHLPAEPAGVLPKPVGGRSAQALPLFLHRLLLSG